MEVWGMGDNSTSLQPARATALHYFVAVSENNSTAFIAVSKNDSTSLQPAIITALHPAAHTGSSRNGRRVSR
jgi:hypothetical protein